MEVGSSRSRDELRSAEKPSAARRETCAVRLKPEPGSRDP